MPIYLDRYRSGDREQVWRDLLKLGPAVRQPPVFDDARAVVRETMLRARQNVEAIIARLRAAGYEFGIYPDGEPVPGHVAPLVPPAPDVAAQLDELEAKYGVLPMSLRGWWEYVGAVDLIGRHPGPPEEDLTEYADPLVVLPYDVVPSEHAEWLDMIEQMGAKKAGPFGVPIAPDDYCKDNVSGGPPYEITVPNLAIDGQPENEWHETTFVNYLRICFRCGGFPGLEPLDEDVPALFRSLPDGLLSI